MLASSLRAPTDDSLVTLLLSLSADPKATTHAGQTALHFAASKANLATARTLVAHGASVRARDRRGQAPLHRAAAVGCAPVVRLCLENRAAVNAADGDGFTALHHAVAEGWGDVAVLLLKAGAEADRRDGEGRRAIELAPDDKVSILFFFLLCFFGREKVGSFLALIYWRLVDALGREGG